LPASACAQQTIVIVCAAATLAAIFTMLASRVDESALDWCVRKNQDDDHQRKCAGGRDGRPEMRMSLSVNARRSTFQLAVRDR
jgi:hypothetical protein